MGRRLVRGRGYRVRRGIIQIRGVKATLVRGAVRLVTGRLVRVRVRIKTTKATHYVGEVIPLGHTLVPHPTPQHGVVGGGQPTWHVVAAWWNPGWKIVPRRGGVSGES